MTNNKAAQRSDAEECGGAVPSRRHSYASQFGIHFHWGEEELAYEPRTAEKYDLMRTGVLQALLNEEK